MNVIFKKVKVLISHKIRKILIYYLIKIMKNKNMINKIKFLNSKINYYLCKGRKFLIINLSMYFFYDNTKKYVTKYKYSFH